MASDAESMSSQLTAASRLCHLGSSSLQTVPGMPAASASGVPISLAIGSPPGLSRASMRQARDACKLQVPPAWGSEASHAMALTIGPSGNALSPPQAVKLARRRAARDAMLARAKEEMALLKSQEKLRAQEASSAPDKGEPSFSESTAETSGQKMSIPSLSVDMDDNEESTDVGFDGPSEDDSASDWSCSESLQKAPSRRCRFNRSALETIPATPVAAASGVGSPPGLSRASMRRARDACKAALPTPVWGGYLSSAVPSAPGKASQHSLSAPVVPEGAWANAGVSLAPR